MWYCQKNKNDWYGKESEIVSVLPESEIEVWYRYVEQEKLKFSSEEKHEQCIYIYIQILWVRKEV